jgi:hypothetical protein
MPLPFPKLCVGEPICHNAVAVFPLFSNSQSDLAYRLSEEAFADQSAVVEEISESGSVPDLLVDNQAPDLLLFLEGEQLIGAKQNRILNTSVLVGGHTKLRIPVSCVEQGRWRYKSRSFDASPVHSPSKLRRALKASVTKSARQKQGHVSDQGEVWQQVEEMQACYDVASPTAAMSDVFDAISLLSQNNAGDCDTSKGRPAPPLPLAARSWPSSCSKSPRLAGRSGIGCFQESYSTRWNAERPASTLPSGT